MSRGKDPDFSWWIVHISSLNRSTYMQYPRLHIVVTEAGTDPPPCGYSIRLRAWDRTIRGRFTKSLNLVTDYYEFGWWKDYMQSFCFETNGG